MKTLIVGVGPARCMTTFFTRQIANNKKIFIPERKEVNLLHLKNLDISRYEKIMFNNDKLISLDYTNNYSLAIENVKKNIDQLRKNIDLKVQFLFFYRDPVKRFISHIELLCDRNGQSYDKLNNKVIENCMNQSIYSNMLSQLDKRITFIYNMDEAINDIDLFGKKISNFLNINMQNFNISINIGKSKKIRCYFIEKYRQNLYLFLEKNDLDWLIGLLRKSVIIKFLKRTNTYEDKDKTKEIIKNFYKNEINKIKSDKDDFNEMIESFK